MGQFSVSTFSPSLMSCRDDIISKKILVAPENVGKDGDDNKGEGCPLEEMGWKWIYVLPHLLKNREGIRMETKGQMGLLGRLGCT